jgi:CheY-like chemotaxis protein/HPt (histidine-containing phosphotransfer) domain-containing protein
MTSSPPRILLVVYDPVCRAFLGAAVQALPAVVDAADSMAAATALAAAGRYDLWMIDANLPDGSGAGLLARLRVRDATTPAVAHTAANDAAATTALLEAGFERVLVKPLPATAVQTALRQALGQAAELSPMPATPSGDALPHWDDDTAVRALNGNREHVAALRKLFIVELPAIVERVRNAFRNEDFQGLHGELHRLRASCGFVGAARLQHAVQVLGDDDRSHDGLLAFTVAAQALVDLGAPVAGD